MAAISISDTVKTAFAVAFLQIGFSSCKSRTFAEQKSKSDASDWNLLQEANKEWVKVQAQKITQKLDGASYDFKGMKGNLCAKAFVNSELPKEEWGELVGQIHVLEKEKMRVSEERQFALQDKIEATVLCVKNNLLPIKNFGLFSRKPDAVTRSDKKIKIQVAEDLMKDAEMCVAKHDALLMRLDKMIAHYEEYYLSNEKKPQVDVEQMEKVTPESEIKHQLIAELNAQTALIEAAVVFWNKFTDAKYTAKHGFGQAIIDQFKQIYRKALTIESLSGQLKNSKHAAPPDAKETFLAVSEFKIGVYNGRSEAFNSPGTVTSTLQAAINVAHQNRKQYEAIAEILGDKTPDASSSAASTLLLKNCSLFAFTGEN